VTTRDRLVEAARELFIEKGYAGTTVHEVARRAGFTTGALYAQFGGKEELLSAAMADAIGGSVNDALERALPGRPPSEAAHLLLLDIVGRPVEPADMVVMHGLADARGEGKEVVGAQLMQIIDAVRGLIEAGQKDGVIDPQLDSEALLRLVAAVAFGSVALKMLDLPQPDAEALSEVVRRFERMLAPPP
jgi:AcrR family transcriptional regulator